MSAQALCAYRHMKKRYDNIITACCLLVLFANVGCPSTSFSVYQPYIVAMPGIGDSGGSFILGVRTLMALVCIFLVSHYYKLFTPRMGIAVSGIMVTIGFILYSLSGSLSGDGALTAFGSLSFGGSLTMMCLGALFTGAGYGFGGMVATTMLLDRWCGKGVGTAVGIVSVGSGVSVLLIPPVVAIIIQAAGLSTAFFIEALFVLFLNVVAFAFLRNDPEEIGFVVRTDDAPVDQEAAAAAAAVEAAKRPLSKRAMTLMLVAMVCFGAVAISGTNYFSVLLTSVGLSPVDAALYVSIMGGCLTVAMAVNGFVFDKLGTRTGSAIFFILCIIGLALCCISGLNPYVLGAVASVLFGTGVALGTVGISMWSLEFAPETNRTDVIRNFQVGRASGGFLFNFVPGILVGLTGSYVSSYVVLLVLCIAAASVVMGAYLKYRPTASEIARREAKALESVSGTSAAPVVDRSAEVSAH